MNCRKLEFVIGVEPDSLRANITIPWFVEPEDVRVTVLLPVETIPFESPTTNPVPSAVPPNLSVPTLVVYVTPPLLSF